MESPSEIVDRGDFDLGRFREELEHAASNRAVGTNLWFENDRVRVWEVRLEPGERGPFHAHLADYFWTVVEEGRGLQRLADGTFAVRQYRVGETMFIENTPERPLIHDLENVGDTVLRFVTVELI
jgi:mannose-6-phosphate isomerase-like protein (cupin superfamily)